MHYERRSHPRVKCPVSFQIMIGDYPEAFGQILNLSMGGVTFIFPEKLHPRSVFDFIVTCPVTPFNLDVNGKIVWSENFPQKNNFISGVVFPYLSEEEVSQLRRVISIFSPKVECDRREKERRKMQGQLLQNKRKEERRKKNHV
ncbi:MAG: PilZ domain-containing protein [bacterium]